MALRVANPVLVRVAPDGGLDGIDPELDRFIATKLNAGFEPVIYRDVQSFTVSCGIDAWDILIGLHTPISATKGDFSSDFMLVGNLCVAAPEPGFAHADQVGRPGVKIAVANGAALDPFLSPALRNAGPHQGCNRGLGRGASIRRDGYVCL